LPPPHVVVLETTLKLATQPMVGRGAVQVEAQVEGQVNLV